MSAMEEIQDRADNIMENIMVKESELAEIKKEAEKAEIEKKALEATSNKMLDEKQLLETDILKLVEDKEKMENSIKVQEQEVVKYVGQLFSHILGQLFLMVFLATKMLVLIGH